MRRKRPRPPRIQVSLSHQSTPTARHNAAHTEGKACNFILRRMQGNETNTVDTKSMRRLPMERRMKLPGPDQPTTIEPNTRRARVIYDGNVVADTTRALALKEANYPAV